MMVCHELGKSEQDVASWHLSDVFRWVAYFRLKAKAEKKAIENARRKK